MIKITPALDNFTFRPPLMSSVRPHYDSPLLAPLSPTGVDGELTLIGNFSYCRDGFGQRVVAEKDMPWNRAQYVSSYSHYTVPPPDAEGDISAQWPIVESGRFYFIQMSARGALKRTLVANMASGIGTLNAYLRHLSIPEVQVTCDVKWSTRIRRGPFVVVDAPEIFVTNTWTLSCLTWFIRQSAYPSHTRGRFWGYDLDNQLEDYAVHAPKLFGRPTAHLVLEMMAAIPPVPYSAGDERGWATDYGHSSFLWDCVSYIADRRSFVDNYHHERMNQVVPYAKYLEDKYVE
jgi:hypothetical protein